MLFKKQLVRNLTRILAAEPKFDPYTSCRRNESWTIHRTTIPPPPAYTEHPPPPRLSYASELLLVIFIFTLNFRANKRRLQPQLLHPKQSMPPHHQPHLMVTLSTTRALPSHQQRSRSHTKPSRTCIIQNSVISRAQRYTGVNILKT